MKQKRREKKPMNIELIPVYIPKEEFQEKKEIVQDLIARILVSAHYEEQKAKRGSIPTDKELK